jgi:hypothetical protein
MVRFSTTAIVLTGLVGSLCAGPATAQFDSIFGNRFPPRPPSEVPGGAPPPDLAPPSNVEPAPPPNFERRPPARSDRNVVRRPGGVQSQPLPPPPGGRSAPPSVPKQEAIRPDAAEPSGSVPGQGPGGAPASSNAALQPGDEVVTRPPSVKIDNPKAVFAGLDKITGRIISFDVAIGETVQFGALQVTPRKCYSRPPTETPQTDAFVEVDEVTLQGEVKRVFNGWMFAASPGLHAVEHPIYDVWLTDCQGDKPVVASKQNDGAAAGTAPPADPRTVTITATPMPRPRPAGL